MRIIYGILLTGILSLSFFFGAYSQEQPSIRQRADQSFQKMEYYHAAQLYERLVQGRNPQTKDFERLAESYYLISAYELAENWYARASQHEDFSQDGLLNYAEVLKMNGKYNEAKSLYHEYQQKYGESEEISLAIVGADSAIHWLAHPTGHTVHNERNINTDLSEFGAIPTSGGMVYTGEPKTHTERSGMTGRAYLKIFSASRTRTGEITLPAVMPDVFNDARYHVGPITANEDEDILYVTRTHSGTNLEKFREDGINWRKANLELKIYRKNGDSWTEMDFPYNNAEEYSLGHASLSDDGQILYYASDMPGGHGGVDVWYSELEADGSWGTPQNAGTTVNSAKDEMFPSVLGDTLYYSSNGFAGMGGLDIYKAYGSKSNFSARKNLGHPLNSAADDFAYVSWSDTDENLYGYISSNRPGGVGSDDIYSFAYIKPTITILLKGMTKDRDTRETIPSAMVTLYDMDGNIIAKKSSGNDAEFEFEIDANTVYRVHGEKQGFLPDSVRIDAVMPTQDTTIQVELLLDPLLVIGKRFVLENIYYDFDKHDIRPDAALVLDELVTVLRDNPTLKIELSSHTDSRGSDSYNMTLSQRRADAAVQYLVSRGIAKERLEAKGYGETRLVNHCANGVSCTIDEHQANRRTEIEILEF